MATQLEPVRTPATAQQVYSALKNQWGSSVGGTPNHQALVMMTAQSALETGSWKSCWNWNVGNLSGKGGDYVIIRAYTGVYRPYRAFPSLDAGVSAYLGLLTARYASAIQAALNGDLTGFAAALKAHGYYEEDESAYLAAMQPRYAALTNSLANFDGGSPEPVPVPEVPFVATASPVQAVVIALAGGIALGTAAHYLLPRGAPVRRRARR